MSGALTVEQGSEAETEVAVIEALRAKPETATIPVIVATAKELTPDEKNRLSGQIQSLMQKGDFLNDEFLEEVKALIK